MEKCDCIPGCNSIDYKYQIDSIQKFSEDEVLTFCPDRKEGLEMIEMQHPHDLYDYEYGLKDKDTLELLKIINPEIYEYKGI